LPVVQVGPLINVPLFPFPERSLVVVPVPSSNVHQPTNPCFRLSGSALACTDEGVNFLSVPAS